MAVVTLHSLADTRRLGRLLAAGLRELGPVALLLRGPLGSGKTTLTAALTAALPGRRSGRSGQPLLHHLQLLPHHAARAAR